MRGNWRLGVAALALVAAACGGSTSSNSSGGATAPGVTGNTIEIGTTNAQTGVVSAESSLTQAGAQAVFDQVNAQGGINGRKIDQMVLDDAYGGPKAVANARTFINKPVFAVYGGYGTVPAQSIEPILNQAKVPYLFPYQGNPYRDDKYTFLVMPVYRDQTVAIIKSAVQKYGKGSFYALFGETADTAQSIKDTQNAVKEAGGTFLGYDQVAQGTTDYTPYALKVKQAHPDFLLGSTDPTDLARYFNSVVAQGALPKQKIIGLQTMADEAFINAVPQAATDMIYAPGPTAAPSNPLANQCKQIVNKYAPGTKITMETLWGCGTAQLFVYALKKAGPNLTRAGLLKTLEGMNKVDAAKVLTPLSFSATNHVGERTMYQFTSSNKQLISGGTMAITPVS